MHRKFVTIIIVVLVCFFAYFLLQVLRLSPVVWQLLVNKNIELKKSDDRTNILLLGIGGGVHEGPNLSDSIILASVDEKHKKATLTSIPRDLWIPDINAKINAAYADGEEKQKGGGLILAKAVVGKVTGQPVDYGVRIDFQGFVKAVDLVGGLDIDVEHTFDDYAYPIEGKEADPCGHTSEEIDKLATSSSELEAFPCRYKHLHFDKGFTHMNGETALEYVRSRHAIGSEGTDFARSKRQEKVLVAFKKKVLSFETLLNPVKVISLYNTLKDNIDTDIPESEFDDFIKLAQKMREMKVSSIVIDYGDSLTNRPGILINPPVSKEFGNAWVLVPRMGNGNFFEIQSYITCELKTENCSITATPIPGK